MSSKIVISVRFVVFVLLLVPYYLQIKDLIFFTSFFRAKFFEGARKASAKEYTVAEIRSHAKKEAPNCLQKNMDATSTIRSLLRTYLKVFAECAEKEEKERIADAHKAVVAEVTALNELEADSITE